MTDCACPTGCSERCTPERSCADPACPCYQMWSMEIDLVVEQTAHLTTEEIHTMMIEAWS